MNKIPKSSARSNPLLNRAIYDQGLMGRGRLNKMVAILGGKWLSSKMAGPKGGRPEVYGDELIVLASAIGASMRLGARGIQGVLAALGAMYGLDVPVPHWTTICRRMKSLGRKAFMPPRGRALKDPPNPGLDDVFIQIWPGLKPSSDIAIDGTGLSIAGPGLYRTQRGKVGGADQEISLYARVVSLIDLATGCCLGIAVATSDRYSEDELARVLLAEYLRAVPAGSIKRFSGDGLYDKAAYYQLLLNHSPDCQIKAPPAINATLWHQNLLGSGQRNRAIKTMRSFVNSYTTMDEARKILKRKYGYTQRNLIETWMSRLVKLSGGRLKGKTPSAWMGQLAGLVTLLNYHITLGWPERDRLWQPA